MNFKIIQYIIKNLGFLIIYPFYMLFFIFIGRSGDLETDIKIIVILLPFTISLIIYLIIYGKTGLKLLVSLPVDRVSISKSIFFTLNSNTVFLVFIASIFTRIYSPENSVFLPMFILPTLLIFNNAFSLISPFPLSEYSQLRLTLMTILWMFFIAVVSVAIVFLNFENFNKLWLIPVWVVVGLVLYVANKKMLNSSLKMEL